MELKNQKVLVVGTGLSGAGAVHLLHQQGARVILLEQNTAKSRQDLENALEPADREAVEYVIGELPDTIRQELSLAVISPAVPTDSPLVADLRARGVKIYSEIELAFHFEQGRILAITGTNGKTTTTTLVGEIMKAFADRMNRTEQTKAHQVFVVGNIGYSYAGIVSETTPETVSVGEISSFQLESVECFHPQVSAILNITPDHLNRHYTMENYAAMKERIAENQTGKDFCVLNYEDPILRDFGEKKCPAAVIWFSSGRKLPDGYYLEGENIFRAENGSSRLLMNVHEMHLVGVCNAENVMAALAICGAAGVPEELCLTVIRDFPPVEHRIEYVASRRGVDYYNDSKGTNPDAAIQGIRAMERPTILIGGGYDKKNTYDEWIEAFDGKVKELVLIGQTREAIAECARRHGFERITFCDTFEECLRHCTDAAEAGDAVLLSPACASWGMFPNYEVRGKMFKEYVMQLDE